MAFIHTNFLTGNDTTGDGSTSLPYKTVFKALGLAASNDTIKVSGGQWVPIAGDFTFTYSSVTVDTSVSQVGIINVDDIITFEDGQFGFDKFHYRVSAITTTTLTLAISWAGPTQIVAGISKLNSYDYSTTGTTAFETWNTTAIQPAGRTNITISGGWNSGYTDNSNGWTVARRTGANANVPVFNATTYLGDWKQNLVFDKFIVNRMPAIINSVIVANGLAASFAVDKIAFTENTASAYLWTGTSPTAVGLFQKDANTPVTLFLTSGTTAIGTYANAYDPSIASIISPETKFIVYGTAGAPTTNGTGSYIALGARGQTNVGNNFTYTFLQGSPNKITYHYRGTTNAAYSPGQGTAQFNTLIAANAYFDKIIMYANAVQPNYFSVGAGQAMQVEDMEITGPYANKSSFQYPGGGQTLIDLSQEGKLIESFISSTFYVDNPLFPEYAYGNLSKLVCQNLYAVQIKDAEGLKTIDPFGSIYYKDPINGDLRVQTAGTYTENGRNWKVIGVYEKPQAAFSATFRLKRGAVDGAWDKIGIQYGPNAAQIVTQLVTLTESYADYIITVDPTTIPNWNTFPFPLYFGIYSNVPFIPDPAYTTSFCYVESINIT
jgi:hypothetical protein